ncbi:MAG: glycoside hydrolase family 3 protein [Spirochaetota bacterium]
MQNVMNGPTFSRPGRVPPGARGLLLALVLGAGLCLAWASPARAARSNLRYLDFYRDDERELVERLSLEEKIGQILIFGFQGTGLDEDYRRWLAEGRLGNLKLFLRNVESTEQVRALTDLACELAARSPAGIPPFIATDLEGGVVNHLRVLEQAAAPAAGLVGAVGDQAYSAAASRAIALTLHELGINMNFAPSVDILTSMDNQVIGTRSYASDPGEVYRMAVPFLEEHRKLGILCAVKHFPGHGMTDFDSHVFSLGVEVSREEMERVHLLPYRELIGRGLVDGCMGNYVIYNNIDPMYPATFSAEIMDGLLRGELGFRGVAITDDLEMEGSASYASDMVKAFILAFRGGNDLILISHTKEHQVRILEAAAHLFRSGALSMEELDERVLRVLRVKKRYLSRFYVRGGSRAVRERWREQSGDALARGMDRGIVYLSSRLEEPVPEYLARVSREGARGLILAPTVDFARLAERNLPGWDLLYIRYFPDPEQNAALLAENRGRLGGYDLVLLGMGTTRQSPWAEACAAAGVPFIILSINNPALAMPYASRALFAATSFEPYRPALDALFEAVFETGVFSRRLPYQQPPVSRP